MHSHRIILQKQFGPFGQYVVAHPEDQVFDGAHFAAIQLDGTTLDLVEEILGATASRSNIGKINTILSFNNLKCTQNNKSYLAVLPEVDCKRQFGSTHAGNSTI